MDQLSAGLEKVINDNDGELVTANLCDVTAGSVTAVASSWRSGVVVVARGTELSIHDSNALEDAARVAFNERDNSGATSPNVQASPAARLPWAELSAKDSTAARTTVPLPSACTTLVLDEEHESLAIGCADGQVLVARHIAHIIRTGATALAPVNTECGKGQMLLAWAGGMLLCTPGDSSNCGFFDWDGNELARLDASSGTSSVTAVAGSPFSSLNRALFAIGRADGSAEVACFTSDGGCAPTAGSVEVVAKGELNLPGESGAGSVEALTWVSSTGLAAVRRVGLGGDASLQLIPVGFTSSPSGSSRAGGSLVVGGGEGFDPEDFPTWHLLGDVAPPMANGQGKQHVSLATMGPLVVCASGTSAPTAPRARAYKVAHEGGESGAESGEGAPRLRECGEWLELPTSLGSGGGGAMAVAFGLQSSTALGVRDPFRSGEGELAAPVSVFCALRDGTLAVNGVLCAGKLDTAECNCAPFQPAVPSLPAGDVNSSPVPEARPAQSNAPRLTRTEAVQHMPKVAEAIAPPVVKPAFVGLNAVTAFGQALPGSTASDARATQVEAASSRQTQHAESLEAQIAELVLAGASTGTANKLPAMLEEFRQQPLSERIQRLESLLAKSKKKYGAKLSGASQTSNNLAAFKFADKMAEANTSDLESHVMDLVIEYEPENKQSWLRLIDDIFEEHDEQDVWLILQKLIAKLRSVHGLHPLPAVDLPSKPFPSSNPGQVKVSEASETIGLNTTGTPKANNLEMHDLVEKIKKVVSQIPDVKSSHVQQWRAKVQHAIDQARQSGNSVNELKKIFANVSGVRDRMVSAVAQKNKSSSGSSSSSSESVGGLTPRSDASSQRTATHLSASAPSIAEQEPAQSSPASPGVNLDLPDYPHFAESYRQFRAASNVIQAAALSSSASSPSASTAQPLDPAADLGAQVAALQEAAAGAASEGEGLQDSLYAIAGGQADARRAAREAWRLHEHQGALEGAQLAMPLDDRRRAERDALLTAQAQLEHAFKDLSLRLGVANGEGAFAQKHVFLGNGGMTSGGGGGGGLSSSGLGSPGGWSNARRPSSAASSGYRGAAASGPPKRWTKREVGQLLQVVAAQRSAADKAKQQVVALEAELNHLVSGQARSTSSSSSSVGGDGVADEGGRGNMPPPSVNRQARQPSRSLSSTQAGAMARSSSITGLRASLEKLARERSRRAALALAARTWSEPPVQWIGDRKSPAGQEGAQSFADAKNSELEAARALLSPRMEREAALPPMLPRPRTPPKAPQSAAPPAPSAAEASKFPGKAARGVATTASSTAQPPAFGSFEQSSSGSGATTSSFGSFSSSFNAKPDTKDADTAKDDTSQDDSHASTTTASPAAFGSVASPALSKKGEAQAAPPAFGAYGSNSSSTNAFAGIGAKIASPTTTRAEGKEGAPAPAAFGAFGHASTASVAAAAPHLGAGAAPAEAPGKAAESKAEATESAPPPPPGSTIEELEGQIAALVQKHAPKNAGKLLGFFKKAKESNPANPVAALTDLYLKTRNKYEPPSGDGSATAVASGAMGKGYAASDAGTVGASAAPHIPRQGCGALNNAASTAAGLGASAAPACGGAPSSGFGGNFSGLTPPPSTATATATGFNAPAAATTTETTAPKSGFGAFGTFTPAASAPFGAPAAASFSSLAQPTFGSPGFGGAQQQPPKPAFGSTGFGSPATGGAQSQQPSFGSAGFGASGAGAQPQQAPPPLGFGSSPGGAAGGAAGGGAAAGAAGGNNNDPTAIMAEIRNIVQQHNPANLAKMGGFFQKANQDPNGPLAGFQKLLVQVQQKYSVGGAPNALQGGVSPGGFGAPAPATGGSGFSTFGGSPAPSGGFGSAPPSPGGASAFGGFGATAPAVGASAGGFGAAPSTPTSGFGAAPGAPGGFGVAPSMPASAGFGAAPGASTGGFGNPGGFGAALAAGGGGFGSSGFGAAPGAPNSGFGAAPAANPGGFGAANTGGFGASPSVGGAPSNGFGTSGFGANAAPGGGGGGAGGFGSPGFGSPAAPAAGGFGQTGFGAPAAPAGGGGFGKTGFGASPGGSFGQYR